MRTSSLESGHTGSGMVWSQEKQRSLIQGKILVETQAYTAWGGCVTACMYVPLVRSHVWQQLTDYPRWVQYFPDITKSEVLQKGKVKRVYQAAQKAFLFFTAQVEIYLNVVEELGQRIQFRFEKGSFHDFNANLELVDCNGGTLLTYTVQATPNIPIPSIFIQQAMNFELPENMRKMRQELCKG
ncbi:cyclase [Aetokthonos hydrillicola Thurmond2011]|jgi:carbon monoxide dehydrogenase subunit G|uniref:Cyclase n=1 Tax=Aetokthonos hydrillicola Thurmond2011 TaxID=2712845 RepID=A0AAP5MBI2_9CYAN|nr:SRPBCC family protein [Aetokthonos hydrillicola]MBO3464322.1 cyclase [Aetokthonos hydrillicola CCALA 1050]MBW4585797.1 cyclase [Aetokthonos hydrillicola CCALA 1050]MDR9899300.1 cyclase [Aetokthonos hydrillicola Thurmond2011]